MNQKDEDSDNDSDYIPDESKGIEGTQTSKRENVANEITEEINSKRRKRKIDSIWEELQSEERNFAEDKRSRANFDKADIFGKSKARELTGSKKQTKVSQRRATASDAIEIKERARVAANKVMSETKEVVEVHKFAGERMNITRKLRLDENPRAVGSTPSSSLDGVLLQIKGPKTVSTVAKSSMDWDNFKEKEGIEDVVANAAKEGYLTRKDFLDRCDVRSFEQEKSARILGRPPGI